MTASPYIISISLFNTIYSCDTLQSELLKASLNQLQTNKQNEMWCFGKLHFTCRNTGIRFLVRSLGILLFTTTFALILWLTPWIKELKELIWLALKSCLDIVQKKPRGSMHIVGWLWFWCVWNRCRPNSASCEIGNTFYRVRDIASSFRIIGHDIKCIPGLIKYFNFKVKRFSEWLVFDKTTYMEHNFWMFRVCIARLAL
jgi:hypothetical protein